MTPEEGARLKPGTIVREQDVDPLGVYIAPVTDGQDGGWVVCLNPRSWPGGVPEAQPVPWHRLHKA